MAGGLVPQRGGQPLRAASAGAPAGTCRSRNCWSGPSAAKPWSFYCIL